MNLCECLVCIFGERDRTFSARVATFDVLYPSKKDLGSDVDPDQLGPYILLQPVPDISSILENYQEKEALGYVEPFCSFII